MQIFAHSGGTSIRLWKKIYTFLFSNCLAKFIPSKINTIKIPILRNRMCLLDFFMQTIHTFLFSNCLAKFIPSKINTIKIPILRNRMCLLDSFMQKIHTFLFGTCLAKFIPFKINAKKRSRYFGIECVYWIPLCKWFIPSCLATALPSLYLLVWQLPCQVYTF